MYQKIVDNFVFIVEVGCAMLMGWDDSVPVSRGVYKVPTLVDGNPVVSIAEQAFECTYIEYLELPASIAVIGEKAFRGGSIKGVQFYVDDEHYCQGHLKIETSAFKDCILLEYFSTMQFVNAGYLAFCGCPKLKNSITDTVYFNIIHPEAFACTPSLKEIHVLQDGWIQANALKNSSITDIHLAEYAKIPDKTLEHIKSKGITLHIYPESPLMELAYDGICVMPELPF